MPPVRSHFFRRQYVQRSDCSKGEYVPYEEMVSAAKTMGVPVVKTRDLKPKDAKELLARMHSVFTVDTQKIQHSTRAHARKRMYPHVMPPNSTQ